MIIQRLEVHGFLGRDQPLVASFNDDLNIITGRNGSGKTTLMKLVWYIISGNILLALKEVDFKRATLSTDIYVITVHKIAANTCKVDLKVGSKEYEFEDYHDDESDQFRNAEDDANDFMRRLGGSVFLPTFRRIEGGFSLSEQRSRSSWSTSLLSPMTEKGPIEQGLQQLSNSLSNQDHRFVSAISTVDIATILLSKFTNLTDEYARLQQETSQKVINNIKEYEDEQDVNSSSGSSANEVLADIKIMIERLDQQRDVIMTPIEAVRTLVQKLINKPGISFGSRLSFGDAANALNSDLLSAGEKQMLSFICYNAFFKNSVFFIDEPELSLHVDWQRQLFSILQDQQSSNQFIIATHSPFIYSKYPDRELMIDSDRGD